MAGPADRSTANARDAAIQAAVEAFVSRHSSGDAVDAQAFVAGHPEPLRADILARCLEYLSFDGLLGHHEWRDDAPPDDDDGREFGEFRILEELGRGGMGVVYLAEQRSLGRRVALKVMASGLTLSKRHVERFRREAMATARLHHPAIVPVHSLVEVDGAFALAMDYVAGRNLADVLDDLRLRNADGDGAVDGALGIAREKGYVAECAMLAAEVASALATAHQNQVVHRDLKPRNLMLDDRRQVRLLDFGLAKSLDASRESLSMSGELTGTAHYMSPEQTLARRVPVDHRADIWSLGVILYELLTLRRPFDGKNLQQVVYQICFQEPTPLQRHNPKVPRDLATICQKALEKDPQKRYQTAAELEADLQRFLRWEPVHAKPATTWTRLARFARRHRKEVAAAAVLLAVTAGLGVTWWVRDAVAGRRADELLRTADARAAEGRVDDAIALGNQALELRNDAGTRERLERFRRIAMEAAWKVAESRQLLDHDRAEALRLALDAERMLPNRKTRSAVLDALGSGFATRALPTPEGRRPVACAWSPTGRRVATVGYGGTVQVMTDQGDGFVARTLAGQHGAPPIVGVAFVDDDTLVTASPDRTLRLWSAAGGPPRTFALGDMAAAALRTSRDGAVALVAAYDPQSGRYAAQVWRTGAGARTAADVQHDGYIVAAALSPAGDVAATCSDTRRVRVWRTDDGAALPEVDVGDGRGRVRVLCFSPDGARLAVGTQSGDVCLFDAATGALAAVARHARAVTCLAFAPGGDRLLTGARDRTARLWSLEAGPDGLAAREAGVLVGHGGPVQDVAFSPDGALALTATGSPEGSARVFDVGVGRVPGNEAIHRYEVGESIDFARFAPGDAARRRVLLRTSRRVLVWDLAAARGVVTLRQPGAVPAIAFAPDGRSLLTGGDDERLRRFDARDGHQLWTTDKVGNPVQARCLDVDGDRVALGLVGGVVQVRGLADGDERARLDTGLDLAVVRFVGDGRLLTAGARGDDAGRAMLWDLATRRATATVDEPSPITSGDVSPDGARALLVVGERDAQLRSLPDLALVGRAVDQLLEAPANVRDARFSPDGRLTLTARDDGTALLGTVDGDHVRTLRANGPLRFATFSPDGARILTGSVGPNGAAQLWRTDDGEELLRFDGHRGSLVAGTFRADGAWAATCARDGTTCIWPTDPVAVAGRLPEGATTPAATDTTTARPR